MTNSSDQVAQYRRDGFIQLRDVFTSDALQHLRDAVAGAVQLEQQHDWLGRRRTAASEPKNAYEQIFIQKVNLWTRHADVKSFVFSQRLGHIAATLGGHPMRLWHDQALFKEPRTGTATPWHQDAVYWPHRPRRDQLTIWIALRDATIANGCMSFIPGSHALGPLPPINLAHPQDLFAHAPQMQPVEPVTFELKAGSVTVHNGLTFHCAGPNTADQMREALAIIYMPQDTSFDGGSHPVTDPLKSRGLKEGDPLNDGELFPIVGTLS
ncbi:MAG TPA: phytanoyl-CoA dioxygenase family protein [Tepidisphaeraceae bacterium]|nr:phytanoyl-CoA dioxygenase family protein [Tepidisphaeraceae bacterium]